MIKDSGTRRQFESGAVRDIDEGKGRCDLLPLDVVVEVIGADLENCSPLESLSYYQQTKNIAFVKNAVNAFARMQGWDIWTAMLELSVHYSEGASKYDEWNWTKGIPSHCYLDSALRHLIKWNRCDDDECHNRAFIWNCFGLIWNNLHRPDLEDVRNGTEHSTTP